MKGSVVAEVNVREVKAPCSNSSAPPDSSDSARVFGAYGRGAAFTDESRRSGAEKRRGRRSCQVQKKPNKIRM